MGGDKWLQSHNGSFPHGNGQGNGNGPSLWSCISSPLLNILREEGFGIKFESPISHECIKLSAIGFVDDMDYIQTESDLTGTSMEEIKCYTQKGLNLWDSMLRTTGGSLEIDKTKTDCVGIDFIQINGLLKMTDAHFHTPLRARDTNGIYRQLIQLKIKDSRKTLGIYQSPTGTEHAQEEYMINKVQTWTLAVGKSHASRRDIQKAMITTIGRTLEYPLASTCLSEKQCNKIMSVYLRGALPKMGYARTTSRDLVYSPRDIMGCGVKNLHALQAIHHISLLLDHGGTNTLTGRLLRLVAESFHIESGIGGDPFKSDIKQYVWISSTWFTDTIKSMQQYRLTLNHNLSKPYQWTDNDRFLMEEIFSLHIFQRNELMWINEVRLHLQVMTFSDLVTLDGRFVKKECYEGIRMNSHSRRVYSWPNAATPSSSSLRTWQRALRVLFNVTDDSMRITRHYIGGWNRRSIPFFEWFFNDNSDMLYKREDHGQFSVWEYNMGRRNTRYSHGIYDRNSNRVHISYHNLCPAEVMFLETTKVQILFVGKMSSRAEEDGESASSNITWPIKFTHMAADGGEKFGPRYSTTGRKNSMRWFLFRREG